MGDVCLCEYMSHGHCGIVKAAPQSLGAAAIEAMNQARGVAVENPEEKEKAIEALTAVAARAAQSSYEIVNDASLELLARTSVSLTRAGIDIIAPSDMMDGRVAAIRRALDEAGFINTPVLSYAAKFASGFYGPFREADSAPQLAIGARIRWTAPTFAKPCADEADVEEGADMISEACDALSRRDCGSAGRLSCRPAYQVSGEYAMRSRRRRRDGWIERERVMMDPA